MLSKSRERGDFKILRGETLPYTMTLNPKHYALDLILIFSTILPGSGPIQWTRGGSRAKSPPLAARPRGTGDRRQRVGVRVEGVAMWMQMRQHAHPTESGRRCEQLRMRDSENMRTTEDEREQVCARTHKQANERLGEWVCA